MTDRWSNPSGSVGFQRFRVWPAGTDSYSHVDLTNNFDEIDAIIGNSPTTNWPPTTGLNGGIYGVIQGIEGQITVLNNRQPVLYGTYAAIPAVGSTNDGTVYVATDTGGVFQLQTGAWKLMAQQPVTMTPATFATLSNPYTGQLVDLVDNVGNSTYRWSFVYNGSRPDQYKWEFIGGSSLFAQGNTGTVQPGWTVQPGSVTITPPRSGIYDIDAVIRGSFPSGASINVAFDQGSTVNDYVTVGTPGALSQLSGVTVFVTMTGGVNYTRIRTFAGNTPVKTWISGSPEQIIYLGAGQTGGAYVSAAVELRLTPRFIN